MFRASLRLRTPGVRKVLYRVTFYSNRDRSATTTVEVLSVTTLLNRKKFLPGLNEVEWTCPVYPEWFDVVYAEYDRSTHHKYTERIESGT